MTDSTALGAAGVEVHLRLACVVWDLGIFVTQTWAGDGVAGPNLRYHGVCL